MVASQNESRTKNTLYVQVAQQIEEMVAKGSLRPGDRIPSVRKMSQQRGVSVSTVLEAYIWLENKGVIEARPQSGFYVRLNLAGSVPEPKATRPPCNPVKVGNGDLIAEIFHAASDPRILPLGGAGASPELMPTKTLGRILASIAKSAKPSINDYDMPPGNLALRRQISRRSLELGAHLAPDDLVVTVGGMEALNMCLLAVARPGDAIAIESPTYYGFLHSIESFGMRAVEIATHPREGMDIGALAEAIKKTNIKAVFSIPNFNNPLGSCMPDEKKKELVELLAKKEIPLIEDDIYGDLYFTSRRPKTCKAFDKKGLVLLCSSFSKSLAPGFRVGWTAPGRFKARVEQLKFMNTIATPTLQQLAIAEFMENGGYDRHQRKIRAALATQVAQYKSAICRYFPEGTKVTRPSGGFMLWIEMPKGADALEVHKRALQAGIGVAPGPVFSPKQGFRGFIRVSCGHPWSDAFDQGLARLGKIIHDLSL